MLAKSGRRMTGQLAPTFPTFPQASAPFKTCCWLSNHMAAEVGHFRPSCAKRRRVAIRLTAPSEAGGSFSKTFYQTVFMKWRDWAFPNGTSWRHPVGGAVKDKDVRSFRGSAATFLKGRVEDSLVEEILGHEASSQTTRLYAEETELELKLDALKLLTPMTAHLEKKLLQLRPVDRQRFGAGGRLPAQGLKRQGRKEGQKTRSGKPVKRPSASIARKRCGPDPRSP